MKPTIRILHLEARAEVVEQVRETLAREYLPADVTRVDGREAFVAALQAGWLYDLVFADFAMPGLDLRETLALARKACPDIPFILVADPLGEEKVVEALRLGATDHVLTSNLSRLAPATRRALEEAQQTRNRREAEAASARMVSLLRAALESTTEGLLVADLTGRVSAYNRKLLTVLGIPEYVLAPMALDRVLQFLADQFHGPRPLFEAMRELGPKGTRTTFNLDGDEGERLIEASCQPQKIGPRTVGHVFAFRDVTSWEQAVNRLEKRIAELEAQLALADPHRERP